LAIGYWQVASGKSGKRHDQENRREYIQQEVHRTMEPIDNHLIEAADAKSNRLEMSDLAESGRVTMTKDQYKGEEASEPSPSSAGRGFAWLHPKLKTKSDDGFAVVKDNNNNDSSSAVTSNLSMHSDRTMLQMKRLFRLALLANSLFLLGSCLQVLVAHEDLKWSYSIQGYPVSVLQAEDEATWQAYQRTQHYQKASTIATGQHDRERRGLQETNIVQYEEEDRKVPENSYWNVAPDAKLASNSISISTPETTVAPAEMDIIMRLHEVKWKKLPEDIQAALTALGYDRQIWEFGGSVSSDTLFWYELTPSEKSSATLLGYTETTWNQMKRAQHREEHMQMVHQVEPLQTASPVTHEKVNWPVQELLTNAPVAAPTASEPSAESYFDSLVESYYDEKLAEDPTTLAPTFEATTLEPTTSSPTQPPTQPPQASSKATTTSTPVVSDADTKETKPPSKPASDKTTQTPLTTIAPTPQSSTTKNENSAVMASSETDEIYPSKEEVLGEEALFSVGPASVSLEDIVGIVAALCFLVVGVLNWSREEQVFHIWLVQGSVSMMLSIACTSFSETSSMLFRTLAFHCYLIEGAFMLRLRYSIRPLHGLQTLSYSLWAADCLFGSSTVVSVAVSYWQLFDADAKFALSLAFCKIVSAWLWLFAAVIYLLGALVLARKGTDHCVAQ